MKKKKIYMIPIMFIIGIFIMLFTTNVKAENVKLVLTYKDGVYFARFGNGGPYTSMNFPFYTINGKVTYCIEPNVEIKGYDYQLIDSSTVLSYSDEIKSKIQLIGYYGYEYPGHQTDNYRIATQSLIWEIASGQTVQLWTERYEEGTQIYVDAEKNEIMRLVNSHYTRPSFNGTSIDGYVGQEIVIEDTNGVLNNFIINNANGNNVKIEDNKLYITPTSTGETSISLIKPNYDSEVYTLFQGVDGSQKQAILRAVDPVVSLIKLNIVGGKITINKLDNNTGTNIPQGEAKLGGAIYGIYRCEMPLTSIPSNNTKIGTITTSENGVGISDYLPIGYYYLLEEQAPEGYMLDETKYYFNITKENLNPTINLYEQVVSVEYDITKVLAETSTGFMRAEVGIDFGFYDKNDNLYDKATTDQNGHISIILPYGTWTVKQLNSTKNYEKVEDFTLEVKEASDIVKMTLVNNPIVAKLRVVKIDAETKEIIKRSGIKFKIFDIEKNEYVCQTITYPNKKTICEFETDENGEFVTPNVLASGKYKLEEIDQVIDGYVWNKNSHEFEIGEDAELINDSEYGIIFDIKFENDRVKGEISIEKKGEVVNITENGIEYLKRPLEGVKFALYAGENIEFNGKIIYTKNEKIDEKDSDQNGKIIFNNLYLGKYFIKEIETLDGYVLDENKYEFELKYIDQYTKTVIYSNSILNVVPKGSLEFTKTDFSESKTLPNTKIEIYTENDELVFTGVTDSEGLIIINELPVGKYFIIETEAPEGYILNEEKMYFEIQENGEVVKATMKDEKIKGILIFSKIDEDGNSLEGVVINIRLNDGTLYGTYTTNSDGVVIIENMEYGDYSIEEISTIDGYELSNEIINFSIDEMDEELNITMLNTKLPQTDMNDYLPFISFTLIIAGMLVYFVIKVYKKD